MAAPRNSGVPAVLGNGNYHGKSKNARSDPELKHTKFRLNHSIKYTHWLCVCFLKNKFQSVYGRKKIKDYFQNMDRLSDKTNSLQVSSTTLLFCFFFDP